MKDDDFKKIANDEISKLSSEKLRLLFDRAAADIKMMKQMLPKREPVTVDDHAQLMNRYLRMIGAIDDDGRAAA